MLYDYNDFAGLRLALEMISKEFPESSESYRVDRWGVQLPRVQLCGCILPVGLCVTLVILLQEGGPLQGQEWTFV